MHSQWRYKASQKHLMRRQNGYSLAPFVQTHCIVQNKCMCILTELIRHLPLALGIRTQDLICHNCFFLWIPYSMHCSSILTHVFRTEPERVVHSISLGYATLRMRKSTDIILQGFHVSFNRIHPATMHRTAREQLLHQVHWQMRHDVQKRSWEFLLKNTRGHYDILHHVMFVC